MRSAFRVIRTVREKHTCKKCDRIVQAPAPSRPIERGIAGPGLQARVLTSKYAEHTPLNRQSEIYERQGVALGRSLLSPLEEALQRYVLTDGKLHADDTPVLLPGQRKNQNGSPVDVRARRPQCGVGDGPGGVVRLLAGPQRCSAADLSCGVQRRAAGRRGRRVQRAVPRGPYKGSGVLGARATENSRRARAYAVGDDERSAASYRRLYTIESAIWGKSAAERLAISQEKLVPLLNPLEGWLHEKKQSFSRLSELAKAFADALNQWEALKY